MKLHSLARREASFIEPMECLAVPKLPSGSHWVYEIKLDGYRALAVKSAGKLNLLSRCRNSFNTQYPLVFEALADLPNNTVIDGEVVAMNESANSQWFCPEPLLGEDALPLLASARTFCQLYTG